jgi:outer membrane immunogenic protein
MAMRKVLLMSTVLATMGAPALAADMLVKAPRPLAVPVWSWTGFYLGGHLGGGWAKSDWFEDFTQSASGAPVGFQDASISPAGFLGGGQVGFDYQTGWVVLGIQADADLASLKGTQGNCFPTLGAIGFPNNCSALIESMGTVTGRVGVVFDRTLFYLLGGFAWEHERLDDTCIGCNVGGKTILDRSVTTRGGWTAGAGLEYAFAGNWSAFLQYNYMRFGTRDLQFTTALADGTPPFTADVRDHIHVVKAGINYRFNWGSVH